MTTPDDIASLAAAALVAAAATDTWTYVRTRFTGLLGRHAADEEQQVIEPLDTYQSAVARFGPEACSGIAGTAVRQTADSLARISSRSPGAADALRELAEQLSAAIPEAAPGHRNLTYRNIRTGGSFTWIGGNVTHLGGPQ